MSLSNLSPTRMISLSTNRSAAPPPIFPFSHSFIEKFSIYYFLKKNRHFLKKSSLFQKYHHLMLIGRFYSQRYSHGGAESLLKRGKITGKIPIPFRYFCLKMCSNLGFYFYRRLGKSENCYFRTFLASLQTLKQLYWFTIIFGTLVPWTSLDFCRIGTFLHNISFVCLLLSLFVRSSKEIFKARLIKNESKP